MMSAEFLGMWLLSKQGELARVFLMHVFMHSTAICCCLWFARLRVQCSRDRCWAMCSAKSGDLSTQKKKLHPQVTKEQSQVRLEHPKCVLALNYKEIRWPNNLSKGPEPKREDWMLPLEDEWQRMSDVEAVCRMGPETCQEPTAGFWRREFAEFCKKK